MRLYILRDSDSLLVIRLILRVCCVSKLTLCIQCTVHGHGCGKLAFRLMPSFHAYSATRIYSVPSERYVSSERRPSRKR